VFISRILKDIILLILAGFEDDDKRTQKKKRRPSFKRRKKSLGDQTQTDSGIDSRMGKYLIKRILLRTVDRR
jgi:hypothetical protein